MKGYEIWLLAIGLAMDCFAVSIANGIILKKINCRLILLTAFLFGLFQAVMPIIGWLCAHSFSHLIAEIDHWIAFAILLLLGGRMVYGSFKKEDEQNGLNPASFKVIITMAIATSIDALAVGVSFAFLGVDKVSELLSPIGIIGLVSFILSLIGLLFGIKFGSKYAQKIHAEFWGGLILIAIGTKILFEHIAS